jgi:hypothetical protein
MTMDNHGQPDEYELTTDAAPARGRLSTIAAGIALGVALFVVIIIAALAA